MISSPSPSVKSEKASGGLEGGREEGGGEERPEGVAALEGPGAGDDGSRGPACAPR